MMSTVTALVLLAAGPAGATAPSRSELTLSYTAESGYAAAVVLRCRPARGPHPHRVAACRALTRVDGDPSRFRPTRMMCTTEFTPITARIEGTWRGRRVDWTQSFGNRCDMNRTTGVVMAF